MDSSNPHVVLLTNRLDEYRMHLVQGARVALAERGLSLLVYSDDPFEPGLSAALVSVLRHTPPRGVIVTLGSNSAKDDLFDLIHELNIPLETVAMGSDRRTQVSSDNAKGMRELMAHLFDDRGVRRPVLVRGVIGQKDAIEREALVRQEMAARNLPLDEDLVIEGDFQFAVTYGALGELLKTRTDLDAVIALNDWSALGAWRALTDRGLRVPEDVLVSGFDNEHSGFMNWPGLTTVDQDIVGQGAAAAASLLAQLDGNSPSTDSVLPARLIVRGSTGVLERTLEEERDIAVTMARMAQAQLAEQDTMLAFNQAMMRCGTVAELVEELSSTHLERLGIRNCVLAIHEAGDDEIPRARPVLNLWDGELRPTSGGPVPPYELLRLESGDDVLVFQPLSTTDRRGGYVIYEHSRDSGALPEAIRIALSRTLGVLLSSEELSQYAQTLQAQVESRTEQLNAEIATRRRTEIDLQRANAELQRSLMLDGLTRIPNRAAFERHLELYGDAGSPDQDLALLFVDVDLFKPFNDHYGHVMGDEALCQVALFLSQAVRYPEDLACRWGGEEFAVVLPGSGVDSALLVAERFMSLLKAAAIPHAASTVSDHLTASVGIAVAHSGAGLSSIDLIRAADQALYLAKDSGRNQIQVAARPAGSPPDP